MNNNPNDTTIAGTVREILLDLAKEQDAMAASKAATIPYWAPSPSSVIGHRAAATVLRAEADRLAMTT